MALTDGQRIPWDDRRPKSFEEKLAAPDVEDAFSLRYRPGPIRPVATVDEDPGRIRLDALFASTYGASERKVDVVKIKFQDQILRVHRKVAPAFARVDARLTRAALADRSLAPFLQQLGGTFVWRNIAGTDRTSAHSYGVSIDLNVKLSHYWRWQRPAAPLAWQNRVPQAIVDAFEAEGFVWGGRWYHYDTMHFEYRPELLDGRCYP
ncbi:MAG: M15 family peptidase [Myxococcales bacterium]|nr:M15 family peptidase [Myxococcales bacterium]